MIFAVLLGMNAKSLSEQSTFNTSTLSSLEIIQTKYCRYVENWMGNHRDETLCCTFWRARLAQWSSMTPPASSVIVCVLAFSRSELSSGLPPSKPTQLACSHGLVELAEGAFERMTPQIKYSQRSDFKLFVGCWNLHLRLHPRLTCTFSLFFFFVPYHVIQELHQAVKSKDILAVLQAFAEGVDLSAPLPGHVSCNNTACYSLPRVREVFQRSTNTCILAAGVFNGVSLTSIVIVQP